MAQFFCFMLQSPHKMANLTQNEICSAFHSKKQYKQHDGEKKMAMWNLHIPVAGLLNSKNPIQIQQKHSLDMYCRRRWGQSTAWEIQTIEQGRGRNGEEEGWGKISRVNEIKNATAIIWRSINTTLPKDAVLNLKFKSVSSMPCSQPLSTFRYS